LTLQEAYKLYSPMKNEHRSDDTVNIEWIKEREKTALCGGAGCRTRVLVRNDMVWSDSWKML